MSGELLTPLILMVVGYVLLIVEVGILPGFGLPGVLGVGCLSAGWYTLWVAGGPLLGVVGIFVSLALSVATIVLFARSRTGRRLVLADEIGGVAAPTDELASAVGKRGTVVSPLRPSGVIEVGGDRFDAVLQDGSFRGRGDAVSVVGQEHGQLVVVAAD